MIYEQVEQQADVEPALFASLDPGVNNLAALTSNVPGFVPVLVNGRPLKSINRLYNKQRAHIQKELAREKRFTSQHLDALTDKRNRRVQHYLHVASHRIIDLLLAHLIGVLVEGRETAVEARSGDGQTEQSTLCADSSCPLR